MYILFEKYCMYVCGYIEWIMQQKKKKKILKLKERKKKTFNI